MNQKRNPDAKYDNIISLLNIPSIFFLIILSIFILGSIFATSIKMFFAAMMSYGNCIVILMYAKYIVENKKRGIDIKLGLKLVFIIHGILYVLYMFRSLIYNLFQ